MYAAATAKPQSIEADHLGPAPIPRPHLVATYKPGREIYAQGDLNDKCYRVSTGAVRVYRLLSDGRRQVVSFHLPGEMFGFEAGSNHSFFAEAITETTLAVFGRRHMQERSRELLALALDRHHLAQKKEQLPSAAIQRHPLSSGPLGALSPQGVHPRGNA